MNNWVNESQEEIDSHNEYLLLEGCKEAAHLVVMQYLKGQGFESLGNVVRDHVCRLREKHLLEYLPTRKRPNREWIEGSWRVA